MRGLAGQNRNHARTLHSYLVFFSIGLTMQPLRSKIKGMFSLSKNRYGPELVIHS